MYNFSHTEYAAKYFHPTDVGHDQKYCIQRCFDNGCKHENVFPVIMQTFLWIQ